jgi:c(7)-type cytochrome triheme protein
VLVVPLILLAIAAWSIEAGEKIALPAAVQDDGTLRLPAELVFASAGADQAVTFRHETHFEFAGRLCSPCHPEPFRMLRPERVATHAAMDAGGSCGSCHDGQQAFGVTDPEACTTCHAGVKP